MSAQEVDKKTADTKENAAEKKGGNDRSRPLVFKKVRHLFIGLLLVPGILAAEFAALQVMDATEHIVQNGLDLRDRDDLKTFVHDFLIPQLRMLYPQRDEAAFIAFMDLFDDYGLQAVEAVDLQAFLYGTDEEARSALLFARYLTEMPSTQQERQPDTELDAFSPVNLGNVRSDIYEYLTPYNSLTQLRQELEELPFTRQERTMVYVTVSNALSISAHLGILSADTDVEHLLSSVTSITISLFEEEIEKSGFASYSALEEIEKQIISKVLEMQPFPPESESIQLLKNTLSQILITLYAQPSFDDVEYFFSFIEQFETRNPTQLATLLIIAEQLIAVGDAPDQELSPRAHSVLQQIINDTQVPPQRGDTYNYLYRMFTEEEYVARLERFLQTLKTHDHRLSNSAYLNYFSLSEDGHIEQLLSLLDFYTLKELEPGLITRYYRIFLLPTVESLIFDDEILLLRARMFEDVFAQAVLENPSLASLLLTEYPKPQHIDLIIQTLLYDYDSDTYAGQVSDDQQKTMGSIFTALIKVADSTIPETDEHYAERSLSNTVAFFNTEREDTALIAPQLHERIQRMVDVSPEGFVLALSLLSRLEELPIDMALSTLDAFEMHGAEIARNEVLLYWVLDYPKFALSALIHLEIDSANSTSFYHHFFTQTLVEMQITVPDNIAQLLLPIEVGPLWHPLFNLLPSLVQSSHQEQILTKLLMIAETTPELADVFFNSIWLDEPSPHLLNALADADIEEIIRIKEIIHDRIKNGEASDVTAFVLAQYAYGRVLPEDVSREIESVISEDYLPLHEAVALLIDSNGDGQVFLQQLNEAQVERAQRRMNSIGLGEADQERILLSFSQDESILSIPKAFSDELQQAQTYNEHSDATSAYFTTHPDAALHPTQTLFLLNTLYNKMGNQLSHKDYQWMSTFTSFAAPMLSEHFSDFNELDYFEAVIGHAIDQRPTTQEDFAMIIVEHGFNVGFGVQFIYLSQEDIQLIRTKWEDFLSLRSLMYRSSLMDLPQLAITYLKSDDESLRSAIRIIYEKDVVISPRFTQLLQTNTAYADPSHPLRAIARYLSSQESTSYSPDQLYLIVDAVLMPTKLKVEQNIILIGHLLDTMTPEEIARQWQERFGLQSILVNDYGAVKESKTGTFIRLRVFDPTVIPIKQLTEGEIAHSTLYLNPGLLYYLDGQIHQHNEENHPVDVSDMNIEAFLNQYRDHHFLIASPNEDGSERVRVLKGSELVESADGESTLRQLVENRRIRTLALVNVIVRNEVKESDRSFFEMLRNQSPYVDFLVLTDSDELLFVSIDNGDLETLFADIPGAKYLLPIDIGRTSIFYSSSGQAAGTDTLTNPLVIAVHVEN